MLLLLAIHVATTSAHDLTCHCAGNSRCHSNGYCQSGCANGWFGPGCQIGNVAFGKTASQSSTYYDIGTRYNHSADRAVDGQMPGDYARYCSHTNALAAGPRSAWWSVVLDTTQYYVITNITIVNRNRDGERSGDRLTNFKILYSNETESNPDPSNSIWHECVEENGTVFLMKTYTCKNTSLARRVAVYLSTEPIKNPNTILTLCEVYIYGYQQYDCRSGYTGPGCLLRTCDQCDETIGQCSEDNGSCGYNICPHRSLLPPECWISLSDYSEADVRAVGTCNTLRYSFDLPFTQPNIAASSLLLQVSTSDAQMVVNSTISLRDISSPTFSYDNAAADTLYKVVVKPLFCGIPYRSCFYATPSKVFIHSTGKRKYVFSHNGSCVFLNVTSDTPDCEPPAAFQVTCQSPALDAAITSSSLTVCGLERNLGYNCSVAAIINANMTERQNVYIDIGLLSSSPATESNGNVLAGSLGGSVAIIVIAAIVAVVFYRRRHGAKSSAMVASQDTNIKSHLPAGTQDEKKLQLCKGQSECPYESLNIELGMQTTGDYASLKYSI